jgi:Fic family protein
VGRRRTPRSPWLEQRRQAYLDHLFEVSVTGDFDPWVAFFCEAVSAQAQDAVRQVRKLMQIKQSIMDRLRTARAKGVALQIAEDLIGFPMLTVNSAKDQYGVSYQAANQAVAKLTAMDILQQRNPGRYDRIFACDEVLQAVQMLFSQRGLTGMGWAVW